MWQDINRKHIGVENRVGISLNEDELYIFNPLEQKRKGFLRFFLFFLRVRWGGGHFQAFCSFKFFLEIGDFIFLGMR